MNNILKIIGFFCAIGLLCLGGCAGGIITSTTSSTKTVTETAPVVTKTLTASTSISTISLFVTNTTTVTVTPSYDITDTITISSSTTTDTSKTVVTTLTTEVLSPDGRLQITEATLMNLNKETLPYITGSVINFTANQLDARITVEIMASNEVLDTATVDVLNISMGREVDFIIENLLNPFETRVTGFNMTVEVIS